MQTNELVQKLQQFLILHGLPKTDFALFGIKCPYCGKSDRIRQLEHPDVLQGKIAPDVLRQYSDFWTHLIQAGESLCTCKFCQHPLRLAKEKGEAETLFE